MIVGIFVDGVKLTGPKIFLQSFREGAAAAIEQNAYSRGGRDGVALGTPFYKGWVGSFSLKIVGDDFADLANLRDYVARIFGLNPDKSARQTRILGIQLANGITKEIPCTFQRYGGDVNPEDSVSSLLMISAQSEFEYLTTTTDLTVAVNLLDLGGMAIPMGIPMSMAESPSGVVKVISNAGSAEFYPKITVHGALGAFELINDRLSKTLSYGAALEEGDTVVFDFYRRTAIKNGTTNVLHNVSGSWWWLAPGDNTIRLSSTSGAGYAEVKYRMAYRGL